MCKSCTFYFTTLNSVCNFYQQALILRSYCSLEVDDDFDAPQLMDEDVFYDDNGASDNYCSGNGGENEVKLGVSPSFCFKEEYKFVSIFCLE